MLHVFTDPPRITVSRDREDARRNAGESIQFECPIVGSAVRYEWLKNDMPVHEAALVDDTISFAKRKQSKSEIPSFRFIGNFLSFFLP